MRFRFKVIMYEIEGVAHSLLLYGKTADVDNYWVKVKGAAKSYESNMYGTIDEMLEGVYHSIDSRITVLVVNLSSLLYYTEGSTLPAAPSFKLIQGGLMK